MPLAALGFYLQSKYAYETKHDAYLFNAIRATLIKKPDSYYKDYPAWGEIIGANKPAPQQQRRVINDKRTPKEIMRAEFAKARGRRG